MNQKAVDRIFLGLIYVLVVLLVREWLLPIIELTGAGHLALFVIFVGLCFAFPLFGAPWWLSGPVKLIYAVWFIAHAHMDGPATPVTSVSFVLGDLLQNAGLLVTGELGRITDPFRTVLFLALLWMASYLIQYWINVKMSVLIFYGMTVIFITILDTFSPYSADAAILRVLVIGFLLLGLTFLAKLADGQGKRPGLPAFLVMTIPLLVLVTAAGAVSQFLPKSDPAWPDPVPFIKSFAEGAGDGLGRDAGKIGYGEDDSMLGGPFIGDDTVVFEATADRGQYWKVETKDTYTSRGWIHSSEEQELLPVGGSRPIDEPLLAGTTRGEDTAAVSMQLDFEFIVRPYGAIAPSGPEGTEFLQEAGTGKVVPFINNEPAVLDAYSVTYDEPAYSMTALRATVPDTLPQGVLTQYLQLPDGLPQRVHDLALEITGREETLYGKARAVEQYFRQNGFVYDQANVASPGTGEDFTDHFLFETKRGYCDHFSTSMVVLLRSAGVPARWVKGFNEGEEIGRSDAGRQFEVTNNNAHSWVEAYMPGVGWMPFEPTIGFDGAGGIDYDLDLEEMTEEETQEMEQSAQPEEAEEEETPAAAKGDGFWKSLGDRIAENSRVIYIALAVLAAAVLAAFLLRDKWLPRVMVARFRKRALDRGEFERSYARLLKRLRSYGLPKEDGKTLSAYAREVDAHFGGDDMKRLTEAYEAVLYGGRDAVGEERAIRESWENLINRTIS
ncbi:transglutaminase domain-containing protein [Bhargavaea ginsengi]|uniref:DUF4129 domain-containing transglutaminase family protein n=1 Tax=Bhargavaea ginsengi TaxID=426757 RepID=UPI00203F0BE2|nr:transglutaminase domain-containing protein [Bhargavaea ginsengi]MCM3088374.1 transglutaminase domain-containing protein [Bhargavaea ginsengi]